MEIIKIIATMVIICGVLTHLLPASFSGFAFDCVVVCSICIYLFNAVSTADFNIEPYFENSYSYIQKYTQHVEQQQRKLFDDIAEKEQNDAVQ